VAFERLFGVLVYNAAALDAEQAEADQPTICPHDRQRLRYRTGLDGELEAVCPLGNYSWP